MARTDNLTNYLTDVSNAIKVKKGDSSPLKANKFDEEILNLPTGGEPVVVPDNDVVFVDYDGTFVHSYTKEEFLQLTDFPAFPQREGMIYTEWNYDFDEAIDYVQKYGSLKIGAICQTSDDKMRIYLNIAEGDYRNIKLTLSFKGTATIHWGDGEQTTQIGTAVTSFSYINHSYEKSKKYIIEIEFSDDTSIWIRGTSSVTLIMDDTNNRTFPSMIEKVELPKYVERIDNYGFYNCYNMTSVNIPSQAKLNTSYCFGYCANLQAIVIPKIATELGGYFIEYCARLKYILLSSKSNYIGSNLAYNCNCLQEFYCPPVLESIPERAFYLCYSLNKLVISDSVKSLGRQSLYNAYTIKELKFGTGVNEFVANAVSSVTGILVYDFSRALQVPTIQSSSLIMQTNTKIYIPASLENEFKSASIWSGYASRMIVV